MIQVEICPFVTIQLSHRLIIQTFMLIELGGHKRTLTLFFLLLVVLNTSFLLPVFVCRLQIPDEQVWSYIKSARSDFPVFFHVSLHLFTSSPQPPSPSLPSIMAALSQLLPPCTRLLLSPTHSNKGTKNQKEKKAGADRVNTALAASLRRPE